MPNGPDDRRYSAAGVLALSFGPPDGHIRLLLTQEKANKSRWRKKMVKRDFWRTMHPFNIPGGSEPPICIYSCAFPSVNDDAAALTALYSPHLQLVVGKPCMSMVCQMFFSHYYLQTASWQLCVPAFGILTKQYT